MCMLMQGQLKSHLQAHPSPAGRLFIQKMWSVEGHSVRILYGAVDQIVTDFHL